MNEAYKPRPDSSEFHEYMPKSDNYYDKFYSRQINNDACDIDACDIDTQSVLSDARTNAVMSHNDICGEHDGDCDFCERRTSNTSDSSSNMFCN